MLLLLSFNLFVKTRNYRKLKKVYPVQIRSFLNGCILLNNFTLSSSTCLGYNIKIAIICFFFKIIMQLVNIKLSRNLPEILVYNPGQFLRHGQKVTTYFTKLSQNVFSPIASIAQLFSWASTVRVTQHCCLLSQSLWRLIRLFLQHLATFLVQSSKVSQQ